MTNGSGSQCGRPLASAGDLVSGLVGERNVTRLRRAVLLGLKSFEMYNKSLKQAASAGRHRATERADTRPPLLRHRVMQFEEVE